MITGKANPHQCYHILFLKLVNYAERTDQIAIKQASLQSDNDN